REVKSATFGAAPLFGTSTPAITVNGVKDQTLASIASDSYFDTLGIPIVRGRTFTRSETYSGARVAIISESTALHFWPGQDPIQKHFQLTNPFQGNDADFEVVGVAKDVRFANPTRLDPVHVYVSTNSKTPNGILVR